MNDELLKVLSKMDTFIFNYTEKESRIEGYITGKSATDNSERYVARISINPKESEVFEKLLSRPCSIEERTIIIDERLLTDSIIEILKKAFAAGIISGIRMIPDDKPLKKEVFDKLNTNEFYGFLVAVHSLSNEIKESSRYLDIREQNGICQIEHVFYNNNDHYNIHLTKKLTKEEIHSLARMIKQHNYQKILVDFYEPSYYRELLQNLKEEVIPNDIQITFLANPLYDEKTCYEGLKEIIDNPITIHYNTCNDLNTMTREEPHTEGAKYYSDIEASGETDVNNYCDMIKMLDDIVDYMEEKNYSPLEKISYVTDYFKKNFIYDPDYQTTSHEENSHLDKVFRKDRMICEGFSNLYSAILRRAGILCFTYGTDDHQKNIVRVVDEKYGVDRIAIIDPTQDLSQDNNRNIFKNFLVPIDNDLYAHIENDLGTYPAPEVINIPTSLSMASEYYNTFIEQSNPVYATNPIGYAIRMLQLMGLGDPGINMTPQEQIEYYKSALARTKLTEKIPYDVLATAVHTVREKEHEYGDEYEENTDYDQIKKALSTRGYNHVHGPKIKLLNGSTVDVEIYKPSVEVDFVTQKPQPMIYKKPRKKRENETNEEFYSYLRDFYDTIFYRRYKETINMNSSAESRENLEEFEIVEKEMETPEIVIYRDMDDMGRFFVTENTLRRFHIERPEYKIKIDASTEVYEIRPQEAAYILEHANNKYAPYIIRHRQFDFNNEIKDTVQEEIKSQQKAADEIIIFRETNSRDRAFVTKSVLNRFQLSTAGETIHLGRMLLYEITPEQVVNIVNNSNNQYAPYKVNYVKIEIEEKKKETQQEDPVNVQEEILIFKDANNLDRSFVNKSVLVKFHIPEPKEKVHLGRMQLYEIDPIQTLRIVENSTSTENPFKIRYIKIEIDVKEKEKPREEILIFREAKDPTRCFVSQTVLERFHLPKSNNKVLIGRMTLYEINPNQALDIIENANNNENPYNIHYISIELDEKKEEEKKATEEIIIFRDVDDSGRAFVTQSTLNRFHIAKPNFRVHIGKMFVYEINPSDAMDIMNNSNNKENPYTIRYVSIQFDNLYDEKSTLENQKEEEYIPGTNFKKPRYRRPDESDDHYVAYLEGYYDSIFGNREIFQQLEKIPEVTSNSPRPRRADETDEEYVEYLATFYATPTEENEKSRTK